MRKLTPGKPTPIKKKEDMTYGEYYKQEAEKKNVAAGLASTTEELLRLQNEARRIRNEKLFIPSSKTKKASTLKTVADQPRELIKRSTSRSAEASKPKLKGLIDKAMTKYKKTNKVGMGGRSVSKEKGLFTRTVDGKDQMVREKTKTVTRGNGTVKKTVTKGKGVMGSNIGRYKDVKKFK
jgi:prolyl oligopeptidase PreP (S9A serine peptidase family)